MDNLLRLLRAGVDLRGARRLITMRVSPLLLQLLYIAGVFAGTDLRSFWSAEGLALSEVAWNSITDRYVEGSGFLEALKPV